MHPFLDNGLTSDHAYQSVAIHFANVPDVFHVKAPSNLRTIHVATWNLQDLCVARSYKRAFSNNPFHYHENFYAYRYRKKKQIEKITSYLGAEDIIFLQEADFLFHDAPTYYEVDPKLIAIQQDLARLFHQKLADNNFGIMLSEQAFISGFPTQKLVTLFDRRKFIVQHSNSVFLTEMSPGRFLYRGLELILQERETGRFIITANVHLKYGESPVQAIKAYQERYNEHATIIGGDTNHVDLEMLDLAFGDYRHATNFSADDNGYLTTLHGNAAPPSGLPKSYDRIFVKPWRDTESFFSLNTQRSEIVEIVDGYPRIFSVESASQMIGDCADTNSTVSVYSADSIADHPAHSDSQLSAYYRSPRPHRAALFQAPDQSSIALIQQSEEKAARIALIFQRVDPEPAVDSHFQNL